LIFRARETSIGRILGGVRCVFWWGGRGGGGFHGEGGGSTKGLLGRNEGRLRLLAYPGRVRVISSGVMSKRVLGGKAYAIFLWKIGSLTPD